MALLLPIAPTLTAQTVAKADLVVVNKARRELILRSAGREIATYRVALGGNPVGHKQMEGDQRTPEGRYVLDYKKTDSAFYRAIHVSYPNAEDRRRAAEHGVAPGGAIMIHGQKNGYGWFGWVTRFFDWTQGCIAVTNSEMDEIWQSVDAGTPIIINP